MKRRSIPCILILCLTLCLAGCSRKETSPEPAQSTAALLPVAESSGQDEPQVPANEDEPELPPENEVPEDPNEDTLGSTYANAFINSLNEDLQSMADELIELNAIETELVKADVVPGYLDGFTGEVTGFSSGVKFSPMIGAIPFVGYIFETDDPQSLEMTLSDLADPAWNICTEADETVCVSRNRLVFFLMCSNEQ